MRRGVIAVVVLLGLLVGADYAAAAVAESAVSRQVREQLDLDQDPAVRINGFPFLFQALSGEYRSVDVSTDGISLGELRDLEVTAQLRDVEAPLSELLGSGSPTLVVGEAEGTVRVTADDLERLVPGVRRLRIDELDTAALQVAVANGADPSVGRLDPASTARFSGFTTILGEEVEFFVIAVLELVDGQVRIEPVDVKLAGRAVPDVVAERVRDEFTVQVDTGGLPLDVTPTDLRARDGGLEITGVTRDLLL